MVGLDTHSIYSKSAVYSTFTFQYGWIRYLIAAMEQKGIKSNLHSNMVGLDTYIVRK